jgi:hypothetical protein
MPARIEPHWGDRVRTLTQAADEKGRRIGPKPLRADLIELFGNTEDDPCPSERWIASEQAAFRSMETTARRQYSLLRWPASFENGALPWEAAAASIEMLRYCEYAKRPRPLVRAARWFWRLRQTAPDAFTDVIYDMAWGLVAAGGSMDKSDVPAGVESLLIWQAWDDDARKEYDDARTLLGERLVHFPEPSRPPWMMEATARWILKRTEAGDGEQA